MSEKIAPALTPEEWSLALDESTHVMASLDKDGFAELRDKRLRVTLSSSEDTDDIYPNGRHALAALALYGQPFGFTPEDVRLVLGCVIRYGPEKAPNPALYDLASRIRALLPPEEKPRREPAVSETR